MIILSHRGYWKLEEERNRAAAFQRSFDLGYGTETDIRDIQGKLVISHDMPRGDEITFEEVLQIMDGRNLPLALNIKADGMAEKILRLLKQYNHTNYFTFDMSIPDMVMQLKTELIVFTGLSDILSPAVLLDQAKGIWLDCFNSDWYDSQLVDTYLEMGKPVCIVSADLHKRNIKRQWEIIKQCSHFSSDSLMLCTDYPEIAKEFFYGENKSNTIRYGRCAD